MALTTPAGTALTNSQATAQQMRLLGTDLFNKALALEGQIVSLRASLTAGTSFSYAPDVVEGETRLATLLTRLQQEIGGLDKIKQDLTIPT